MISPDKEEKQRLTWERMKRRGRLSNLVLNIMPFLGGYALVRIVHVLAYRMGVLRSPGSTSWEDVFFSAVVTAIIFAELQWSDLKRKFKDPPPEEDWMAK